MYRYTLKLKIHFIYNNIDFVLFIVFVPMYKNVHLNYMVLI